MKAGNYVFEYRSHMDHALCWKRIHCETMEDIEKAIKKISLDHGQVEEYNREMTNEEWYEQKKLYEEQEQNES